MSSRQIEAPGVDARDYVIALRPLCDHPDLAADWQSLERRSPHSFFQSWDWIGCWLDMLPDAITPLVLEARAGDSPVGLAVFVEGRERRRGVITSKTLRLTETGDPRIDEVTIEHNGILCDRDHAAAAVPAILRYLGAALTRGHWDEVFLPGVAPDYEALAAAACPNLLVWKRDVSHVVDCDAVRAAGGDYLAQLGKKTRQHLRRTLRLYEARGAIAVTAAQTTQEALDFFESLMALHQADWNSRGEAGAFQDPWFVDFHQNLIRRCFDKGYIQLLRMAAGAHTIGYSYHFLYQGRVYSYQWGLTAEDDPKINYGVASDYLAVVHNLERGAKVFDFLHGDSLHKRRLGTDSEERLWLVMQRKRLDLRVENALRDLKRRYAGGDGT